MHNTVSPAAPTAEFDAYAEDYDAALNRGLKFTGETKEYFAENRVLWLKDRLQICGAKPQNCLDFGCGTGTSAPLLVEKLGLSGYTGYDPSGESVAEAQALHKGGPFTFTHETSQLQPDSFDMAFCNGVFHHIPVAERAAACELIYRSLKPDGWFVFWENNKWNPIVHWVMSRVPFDRDAIMLFPSEADGLMRDAKLQPVLRDYLFVFPSSLKALRPLEPALCKLPLGGQYMIMARKK